MYPIGTIYETQDKTFDPNTVWGGIWNKIEGKQLIAADGVNYISGNIYGGSTHSHTTGNVTLTTTQIPAHYHTVSNHAHSYSKSTTATTNTALTVDQMPGHTHGIHWDGYSLGSGSVFKYVAVEGGSNLSATIAAGTGGGQGHKHNIVLSDTNTSSNGAQNTSTVGGTQAHNHGNTSTANNLFTSEAIIVWKRIS